jgi:leader peptidase (prepilin peptidase) / N-methyltransferase
MTILALLAGIGGALLGAGADRLAARWPAHPDGSIRPLDWRSVVVVAASAVAFAALGARWDDPGDLLVLGIYLAALIVLLAIDLDQRLLPDVITLPLAAYALLAAVIGLNPLLAGKELGLASAVAAGLGAPLVLLLSDRLFRGDLGMGDVKLSVSLGLMAGVSLLVAGFLVASAAAAVVLIALMAAKRLSRRSTIPFGPILVASGVLAMLLGASPG